MTLNLGGGASVGLNYNHPSASGEATLLSMIVGYDKNGTPEQRADGHARGTSVLKCLLSQRKGLKLHELPFKLLKRKVAAPNPARVIPTQRRLGKMGRYARDSYLRTVVFASTFALMWRFVTARRDLTEEEEEEEEEEEREAVCAVLEELSREGF